MNDMKLTRQTRGSSMISIGLLLMASRGVLQYLAHRAGYENDTADFLLGLLMGIGIGLTLLGLHRQRRHACATALILAFLFATGCASLPAPRTVATSGGAVFVDDGGRGGIPILFVHGNGGSSQQWRSQLDHFRGQGRRALAVDLPGFGKSAPPPDNDYSLARMTATLDDAVRALHLKRFILAGHSYAGAVVATYAAAHPEKVAGIVYVDAAASNLPLTAQQKEQLTSALHQNKMAVVRNWFAPMLAPSAPTVQQLVLGSVEQTATDAFIGALMSLADYDAKTNVRAYRGPRLAIVASDLETPISFQNVFPDIETVRIKGAGHWVMLDKPEEVNTALDAFAVKVESASTSAHLD
jgi:pimeloyl-ACP methyl ester carboxylesterase